MPATWLQELINSSKAGVSPIPDLIDAFGSADGTIADVTGAFSQSILNNNFQDLSTKVNLILACLRAYGLLPT